MCTLSTKIGSDKVCTRIAKHCLSKFDKQEHVRCSLPHSVRRTILFFPFFSPPNYRFESKNPLLSINDRVLMSGHTPFSWMKYSTISFDPTLTASFNSQTVISTRSATLRLFPLVCCRVVVGKLSTRVFTSETSRLRIATRMARLSLIEGVAWCERRKWMSGMCPA